MNYFSHGWGMGFGWLIPILILVLIVYVMKDNKTSSKSEAQDILDKRYANGGISKEEYEEKSNAISKQA